MNFVSQCGDCGTTLVRDRKRSTHICRSCAARKRSTGRFGPKSNAWKDGRSALWRKLASGISLVGMACEDCGSPSEARHHIDGNRMNFDPKNIAVLCRRCHGLRHSDQMSEKAKKQWRAAKAAGQTTLRKGDFNSPSIR